MKKRLIFLLLFFVTLSSSCAHSQDNKQIIEMKSTSQKLLTFLFTQDSISVNEMFTQEDELFLKPMDEIVEDCKLVKRICKKHGVPDIKSFTHLEDNGNLVNISLIKTPDLEFNFKSCYLTVIFYPTKLLTSTNKIVNYKITRVLIKKPKKEIIIAPVPKVN